MGRRTLCVDFDGVIHQYTSPWTNAGEIHDGPVSGAIRWLRTMLAEGFEVCVYSSRGLDPAGIPAMRAWLVRHGMPSADVDSLQFPTQKLPAVLTIDDRCFRFEGDFPSADYIRRFRPWNR